tara:strand:- start:8348 stop:8902 length:555 start_codon:yes stop_codon:yes gene_type:complete
MSSRESKKTETPIVIYGREYPSIRDAIEKLKPDVSEVTIRARRRYEWTPEEMFGFEKRDRRHDRETNNYKEKSMEAVKEEKEKIVINGVEYDKIKDACEDYDIDPKVVSNRMYQNRSKKNSAKWTLETAITTPTRIKPVYVRGVKYRSANAALNEIGKVTLSTFQSRKRAGMSLEDCLGLNDED